MNIKQSLEKQQTPISYFIVSLTILYSLWVFSGAELGIFHADYDSWRIAQVILLTIISLGGLVVTPMQFSKKITSLIFSIFILGLISTYFSHDFERSLVDLALYFMLFIATLVLMSAWQNIQHKEIMLFILAITPLLTILWLPVNIMMNISNQESLWWWHGAFINVRYFDDTLLPIIFIAFYLTTSPKIKPLLKWLLSIAIGFYLYGLLNDGARAPLLSCLIGAITILIINRPAVNKSILKYLIISLLVAILLYAGQHLLYTPINSILFREVQSSSGRVDLWTNAIYALYKSGFQLLLGSGGNPISGYIINDGRNPMHPHNFIIQWLYEWGILSTLSILALVTLLIKHTFKQRLTIPNYLLVGLIAIAIDALLSGSWVYPMSQINCILLMSLAFSHTKEPQQNHPLTSIHLLTIAMACFMMLFLSPILNEKINPHFTDSEHKQSAPRFWLNGK